MVKNTVLSQIMQLISRQNFQRIVKQHGGDRYHKRFSCWNQLLVMMVAQAKSLMSLRDLSSCFRSHFGKWYHLGLQSVARSTLADANAKRPAGMFEALFHQFLVKCRELAPKHKFRFKNPLYTMDATTISLCLSVFPWAKFRKRKGGLKIHTLLDHRGTIPSFIAVEEAKRHDVTIVKDPAYAFPTLEPDSIISIDRAYIDYKWLYSLDKNKCFFVTRAKTNLSYGVIGQLPVSARTGVVSDEIIALSNYYQITAYPKELRLVTYKDPESGELFIFLTNNFKLAARTIALIYKERWQIELFFKWIKQHLKIKTFLGTTENAVLVQIWVAMIYYMLLSFIKFQTKYSYTLLELTRTIREILMEYVSLFEFLRLKYEQYFKRKQYSPQLALF